MDYEHSTGFFRSAVDSTRLFCQRWRPPNARPDWNLVFHHGFGEHSQRYGNLLEALDGSGVTIYALDARGHGRSDGKRGDANGQSDYVRDLESYLANIRERYGVEQPALLGHSMGGAIVLMFALRYSNQWELSCLLTSGAALRVRQSLLMRVKKLGGSLLSGIKPDLTVPAGIDVAGLSHDSSVVESYRADPLVHGDVTARMALDLLEAGEGVIKRAALLKIPLLMQHGQNDPITDPSGSVDFYRAAGSADSHLILYPGLFHEIFNELPHERTKVLHDLRTWLLAHMPAAAEPEPGPIHQVEPTSRSGPSPLIAHG